LASLRVCGVAVNNISDRNLMSSLWQYTNASTLLASVGKTASNADLAADAAGAY